MITLIIGMAILTFFTRALFILANDKLRLSKNVTIALSYTPPVVLTVIVVTTMKSIAQSDGSLLELFVSFSSLLVAALIVYRFRSLFMAISVSLIYYLIFKVLVI
ncbi:MAG: hypothetical protein HAW66_03995 [Shewanella sp.]|nr:hypothetical protein [Shewanella sp.]